jgi:hypothetical protein
MSTPVDREGTFRAEITEYGLSEMDSGSMAVKLKVKLLELWNKTECQWEQWAQYDMEAEGSVWIVKKNNGGLNQRAAESLINFAGWDGDLESLVNESWRPTKCAVVIASETYNNETKLKITFVNDFNRTPGAIGNVSPESVKAASARYGGQLRALAGNVKRNGTTAPAGNPPTPPSPPPPPDKRDADTIPW